MKNSDLIIRSAFTGLLSLGLATMGGQVYAAQQMEKCGGIVKAGKNDCDSAANACAGTSKMDSDKSAWILVPKGTCAKIVGGMDVSKDPNNKPGGAGKS
ncbi:MAG: DUF2282 domain-containing protein [Sulfuricella sp.]|jgi:uncharacterized membrane protein